jgi:hypothetical protein
MYVLGSLDIGFLLLDVSTSQWAELDLDDSILQRPVLHLDVSTTQGLDVSGKQEPLLLLEMSTLKGALNLTTPQRPELHHVSGHRSLCCS